MLPPAVAVDLDGVVWRAATPIPGAADAIVRLRAVGVDVVFVTNNAYPTLAGHEAKLAAAGIDAAGAVISSPMGAAALLRPGERVLVAGGAGVLEAVGAAGAEAVTYDEADAPGAAPVETVVVGFHQDFDYAKMRIASTAVRRGARLVATNDDATYPTERGEVPGNGSILAGIATAGGVAPIIAGKPHEPIATVVRDRCGPTGMVIGDRVETDGLFAVALGWDFGLVLSGVTTAADLPVVPTPALVADDLAGLVDQLLVAR
ncbi:MAG: HAD-IIA family hydrolase [Acidimicrobiia bacterium]|nr:HAD-IIA family hydrolase [Acidimicrobiia bacterium]